MVRKSETGNNLRILDRQNSAPTSEGGENKTTLPQQKVEVDIGLDVSTSVVGVCVVNHSTGNLISLFPIKLTSSKLDDLWDKASEFKKEFTKNISPSWIIKRLFVEDVAKKFSPGFSSAGTIVTLAKMNAIACLVAYEAYGIKPTFVNVRSARAQIGIKIDTKDKTRSTKEKVFEKVLNINPGFPWLQHMAKTGKNTGQMVYDACNQDMGDAWIAVCGGQKLFPVHNINAGVLQSSP